MQLSSLLGSSGSGGIRERYTLLVIVESVGLVLGKIGRYFNLLARVETDGLDVDRESAVASLLDLSDVWESSAIHEWILSASWA